jgi:hypothetical protein
MVAEPGFEPGSAITAALAGLASVYRPRRAARYRVARLRGRVTFNYSDNDGRYSVGDGQSLFETKWTKASETSIHLYSDPESIDSIALAEGATSIEAVTDAKAFDFSSRARTLNEGEVGILKNVHGTYAAIQVVDVRDRNRGDEREELTFRFVINPRGVTDFS